MNEKWKFKIDPRIFLPLGIDLYSTISGALLELYANAWDGKAINVNTTITKDRLIVKDDGQGMSKQGLRDIYLFVGINKRQANGHKFLINFNGKQIERAIIGNKGIGKLAGFGIANIMKVISWANKEAWMLTLDMNQIQKHRDINEIDLEAKQIPFSEKEFDTPSGTVVSLEDPKINFLDINENMLRSEIARNMPISDAFVITVNGMECKRSDVKFQKSVNFSKRIKLNHNGKLYDLGLVNANFGISTGKLDSHIKEGVLVKVRGKGIGEPKLFGIERRSHMVAYLRYLTGEISCQALDEKDEGLITAGRDEFIKHNPIWQAFEMLVSKLVDDLFTEFDRKLQTDRKERELKKLGSELKNITRFFSAQHKEKTEKEEKEKKTTSTGKRKKYTKHQQEIDINRLRIRIGNNVFYLTYIGTSPDEPECSIDQQKKIININTAHPMFNYGKTFKCSPLQIFKSIAYEYANYVTQNIIGVRQEYNQLNKLYAKYMLRKKREKKKEQS